MMEKERFSGILLHPTSLPGPFGIGDFGPAAFAFLDFLETASVSLWQILPMGPTGFGNSPYASRSTFAGNILLVSPEQLVQDGLLPASDLKKAPSFPDRTVDYPAVESWKIPLLYKAAETFLNEADTLLRREYEAFCSDHDFWLDDYAAFDTAAGEWDDSRWYSHWEHSIGFREPGAVQAWTAKHKRAVELRKALQFIFFRQWYALKRYANDHDILLIGDIPIFVPADSADAWANTRLFKTDRKGQFSAQSGVPPDFFSSTGQLWGTPVYDWQGEEDALLDWWMKRVSHALAMTDILRIDHFRGLESYWEVPAGARTAIQGKWVKASGSQLFSRIRKELGDIPIIAEDLGVVTPEVVALREAFSLPGMRVLQFAFDRKGPGRIDPENSFLPHNYTQNCAAYTGTHDNDTTLGWYERLEEADRDVVRRYLARPDADITWSMIRQIMSSVAKYAIFPMQDLLSLGSDCRMNRPSSVGAGNWSWRMLAGEANPAVAARFEEMVRLYGR